MFSHLFGEQRLDARFARRRQLQFRCFGAERFHESRADTLNYGSKILLPQSALSCMDDLPMGAAITFCVKNPQNQRFTHAGVLEFVAEEGRTYFPQWMMSSLGLQDGDLVQLQTLQLPRGTFVKIQPQSADFLSIHDPRAVLEQAFRGYSTLTIGDTIPFVYNSQRFDIQVLELRPADAVCIIETDLEVDFAPPVGYVEPNRQSSESLSHMHPSMERHVMEHVDIEQKTQAQRLPSRRMAARKEQPQTTLSEVLANETPLALRLPCGHLFFGFPREAVASSRLPE